MGPPTLRYQGLDGATHSPVPRKCGWPFSSPRGNVRQDPRPVRRRTLEPQDADLDPGPRPGGDLPAALCRGGRLAALGFGDQGAARLANDRGTTRPQGYRPLFQYLLRGDQPNLLRRNQADPAGALSAGAQRPGRAQAVLGP